MTLDDFLIDKRTVERHIKDGKVDRAAFQRSLDALPDRSANVWRRPLASEVPPSVPVHAEEARPPAALAEASDAQPVDAPL